MQMMLQRQREAFLEDCPPGIKERQHRLRRLRAAVLAHRPELEAAVSTDFGNRSIHETGMMELMGIAQSIDYLLRHLRRFIRRERRHVGLSFRSGSAWMDYQPLGLIGIMAP